MYAGKQYFLVVWRIPLCIFAAFITRILSFALCAALALAALPVPAKAAGWASSPEYWVDFSKKTTNVINEGYVSASGTGVVLKKRKTRSHSKRISPTGETTWRARN